jgi:formylglycine-generating enzyme required for sulfatase activity
LAKTSETDATQVAVKPPAKASSSVDSSPTQVMTRRRQGADGRRSVIVRFLPWLLLLGILIIVVCFLAFRREAHRPPAEPPEKSAASDPLLTNSIGMKLALIPAGEFLMGSPPNEKGRSHEERVPHHVQVSRPFHMGIHEVTRGQFRQFVDATNWQTQAEKSRKQDSWRSNRQFEQDDNHPVLFVSWTDAQEFCRWLSHKEGRNYRLPTEVEWEYACRAGTATAFHQGDSLTSQQANIDDAPGPSRGRTTPVGSFPSNAWGLYDMHGNVWEWCQDAVHVLPPKASLPDDTALHFKVEKRVLRGGSWDSPGRVCRAAVSSTYSPGHNSNYLGFRVVMVTR